METFINQHKDQISGVLSCYDRLLLQGNLHTICWAEGMSNYLTAKHIRIFDYPKYTNTIREQLKHDVEEMAKEHHVQIEFIPNKNTRKEGIVKEVLKKRGHEEPGLVHIISAMETCSAYKPCYDDKNKKSYLKPTKKVEENNRNYRGFNFFDETDLSLLSLLMSGEFNIRGFSNHDLRQPLEKNSGQISRLLKNLRVHGLIKKVAKSYRYYVTKIGKHIIAAALKLKEMFLAPELAKNF